jgi:hypothetical protein
MVGEGYLVGLTEERQPKEATTMKRLLFLSVLVLALIAMLLVAGPVAAKATRTELTACEYDEGFDPDQDIWTFPGPNMHLRGRIHPFHDYATDERVTGLVIVVASGNFNEDFIGTAWGTFTLVPDDPEYDGGYWEGTWVGPDNQPEIRLVGHGRGNFKGLELRETLVWDAESIANCPPVSPESFPISGYIEGYILDPGK